MSVMSVSVPVSARQIPTNVGVVGVVGVQKPHSSDRGQTPIPSARSPSRVLSIELASAISLRPSDGLLLSRNIRGRSKYFDHAYRTLRLRRQTPQTPTHRRDNTKDRHWRPPGGSPLAAHGLRARGDGPRPRQRQIRSARRGARPSELRWRRAEVLPVPDVLAEGPAFIPARRAAGVSAVRRPDLQEPTHETPWPAPCARSAPQARGV